MPITKEHTDELEYPPEQTEETEKVGDLVIKVGFTVLILTLPVILGIGLLVYTFMEPRPSKAIRGEPIPSSTSRNYQFYCEFCFDYKEVISYKRVQETDAALQLTDHGWGTLAGHLACKDCRERIKPVRATIDVDGELKIITIYTKKHADKPLDTTEQPPQ